jgi:hypothetical protein
LDDGSLLDDDSRIGSLPDSKFSSGVRTRNVDLEHPIGVKKARLVKDISNKAELGANVRVDKVSTSVDRAVEETKKSNEAFQLKVCLDHYHAMLDYSHKVGDKEGTEEALKKLKDLMEGVMNKNKAPGAEENLIENSKEDDDGGEDDGTIPHGL